MVALAFIPKKILCQRIAWFLSIQALRLYVSVDEENRMSC